MKIIDKTPYRNDAGEIDIVGRIQGTLKYGLTWYNRIQAQEAVITVLEKQLGSGFTLLRNATLPNSEITLPLVLVGPPGVFLINVTHERGVYLAKDDEWGTITEGRSVESRNFAPARINQVSRTLTFGRVLQVYLDRYGFKGTVAVESILMAADPGMHIESTRPAVRIVMSDALERFAASIAQGRGALNQQTATEILNAIVVGRAVKPALDAGAAPVAEAGSDPGSALPPLGTYASEQPNAQSSPAFSSGLGDFSFDDAPAAAAPNAAGVSADTPVGSASPAAAQAASGQAPRQQAAGKRATAKSKGPLGLTSQQWLILGGLLTLWICIMLGGIVVYYFANR
jgi:hypothetical protein